MIEIKTFASSSRGNAYRVTDGRTPLLLEAGISFPAIRQKLNFQTSDLAGCLISHNHSDHCKAVGEAMKAGIDCFMSQGTADILEVSGHRLKVVGAKKQFQLGTWTILPFETEHDAAEPLGFLLANQDGDKLLFATDTYYVRYLFRGLTHIMVETNYARDILEENVAKGFVPPALKRRLIQSHFSLENVKEFLKANDLSRVQEIHLLHLSEGNSDEARFKREIQQLTGRVVLVAPA